jgi:mono/diheme cytochrome c family protein
LRFIQRFLYNSAVRAVQGFLALLALAFASLLLNAFGATPALPKARPLTDRKFERTEKRLQRGKYLAQGILQCFVCHSERKWKEPGAPPVDGEIGAGRMIYDEKDHLLASPNITPNRETGAGTWSDDMLARAIREGIGHDGRALHPFMWWRAFSHLPDEDLASVVVYLRSLPAVKNALPKRRLTPEREKQILNDPEPIASPVAAPVFSNPIERGRFLSRLADCGGCHTYWYGQVNPGFFAGGNPIALGPLKAFSTNLTPDPSGIPYYDEALFREVMRTGSVKARHLSGLMPWIAFRNMNDEDLNDLFAFLKNLKPVHHNVANGETPVLCRLCGQTHGYGAYNQPWNPQPAKVNPAIYDSYVGKYKFADGFVVAIEKDKDKLLAVEGGDKIELIPQSESVFVTRNLGSPLTFVRDAAGKVTHVLENSANDPAEKIQ